MATMTSAGSGWSQEPGVSSVAHVGGKTQVFGLSSAALLGHEHGAEWEVEELKHIPTSTWDANITGSMFTQVQCSPL